MGSDRACCFVLEGNKLMVNHLSRTAIFIGFKYSDAPQWIGNKINIYGITF
jgi:hypothetical protein